MNYLFVAVHKPSGRMRREKATLLLITGATDAEAARVTAHAHLARMRQRTKGTWDLHSIGAVEAEHHIRHVRFRTEHPDAQLGALEAVLESFREGMKHTLTLETDG